MVTIVFGAREPGRFVAELTMLAAEYVGAASARMGEHHKTAASHPIIAGVMLLGQTYTYPTSAARKKTSHFFAAGLR